MAASNASFWGSGMPDKWDVQPSEIYGLYLQPGDSSKNYPCLLVNEPFQYRMENGWIQEWVLQGCYWPVSPVCLWQCRQWIHQGNSNLGVVDCNSDMLLLQCLSVLGEYHREVWTATAEITRPMSSCDVLAIWQWLKKHAYTLSPWEAAHLKWKTSNSRTLKASSVSFVVCTGPKWDTISSI
jgi:hypothetical protein